MTQRMFAAVGTDVRGPVIWGVGFTSDDAKENADYNLRQAGYHGKAEDHGIVIHAIGLTCLMRVAHGDTEWIPSMDEVNE